MFDETNASKATSTRRGQAVFAAIRTRLRGPGGLYNLGNGLGLISGVVFALANGSQNETTGLSDAVATYLAGDLGHLALTVSMLIFIWSGELYHRASCAVAPRAGLLLRKADLLAAIAALFLSVSLIHAGNVALAVTSTALLAGGKLGSALVAERGWPLRIETVTPWGGVTSACGLDVFRIAVILSRLPAMASLSVGLVMAWAGPSELVGVLEVATLLLCYGLWTKADLLLTRDASP